MKEQIQLYRKNFALVVTFLVLISISLVVAMLLAYNLTKKYVENEFVSQKIEVLEEVVNPYNDLFQNKIPEISFYQGFLDSSSVRKYADTVFIKYPFVNKIVFYDAAISNIPVKHGLKVNNFSIGPKAIYQFGNNVRKDSTVLFKKSLQNSLPSKTADEFNKMAIKFAGFVESADTTKTLNDDDRYNIFYSVNTNRITYMSIPRREDLRIFKELMLKKQPPSLQYEQDMMTFYMDPFKLKVLNPHPELYQHIIIKPLVYESLSNNPEIVNTDIPLPGAFSDYKLYLSSSKSYLRNEINIRFLPIALGLLLIYGVLVLIAYLIFRNLNINSKMFKLQYDFINNLTHEFKTPVSVIKIAGNNIRSSTELSVREKNHYGKILDEEADKLNDLMNRLLSFTQIENRAIKIKEEVINLEVFCQNIIDAYQIKYPHFEISCAIEGVNLFKADPVLLGSLFQNLIDNAYKYSLSDKKELHIVIRRIRKHLIFRFTDQGIGIPKKELDNIFKKFYRIQSEYNQQGSVGLGLAFCKELVNFMHGSIAVKSRVGKGSEFKIALPFEELSLE
ncbi:MAG: HAMP domain-containing sensor histidine kinase [Daejeonella sp.]